MAWYCDHTVDCHDKSDEENCDVEIEEIVPDSIDKNAPCSEKEFACTAHDCIPLSWVCDSMLDCANGVDENATFCR